MMLSVHQILRTDDCVGELPNQCRVPRTAQVRGHNYSIMVHRSLSSFLSPFWKKITPFYAQVKSPPFYLMVMISGINFEIVICHLFPWEGKKMEVKVNPRLLCQNLLFEKLANSNGYLFFIGYRTPTFFKFAVWCMIIVFPQVHQTSMHESLSVFGKRWKLDRRSWLYEPSSCWVGFPVPILCMYVDFTI